MRVLRGMIGGLLLMAGLASARADDGRCGAGKDLVVQALEVAGPQSGNGDFLSALQLLKTAASMCSTNGDAWYYRSLVEARLGHAPQAKFALEQARQSGSDAMNQGLQPFVLATPAGRRGVGDAKPGTAAPSTGGPSAKAGAVGAKWALVIGISKFSDRVVPALNYTADDARSFAALLSDPGIGRFPKANVHVLTDAEATTRNIKEQLNWIARHAAPNDMVVIYLATHGSPRETDTVGQLNYLVTYDTEVKSLEKPDEDALYATALPMVDVSNTVATRMKALRTLVVLDTCYSGGSLKNGGKMMGKGLVNASPTPAVLERMSAGSGRIVLAASQADQESLESPALRHGYFTYFLLKRLTESKGLTPLTQVFASVQKDVADRVTVDTRSEGLHQNPVMDRSADDADFALGLTAAGATASLQGLGGRAAVVAAAK